MARKKSLDEILKHLDEVERMAQDGATEEQIARSFGIARQTLYSYKMKNEVIFDAIKKGRTNLVKELRGTLIKKAKGFSYVEKKIIKEEGVVVREEETTKVVTPDVAALNLLLKNYDKEFWANDPQMIDLRKKELEIQEKKLELSEW